MNVLTDPFSRTIASGITATAPLNIHTHTHTSTAPPLFYHVIVE